MCRGKGQTALAAQQWDTSRKLSKGSAACWPRWNTQISLEIFLQELSKGMESRAGDVLSLLSHC